MAALPPTPVDVCIVGGGPAGLSAAHAILAIRPSLKVTVCERSDLRPRGGVVFLPPNGVRAIQAISPAIKQALQRHHTTHLKTRSFSPAGELIRSSDDGGPMAAMAAKDGGERMLLPWHALQRELADALPPQVLHTEHRFLRYTETPEGVMAEFEAPGGRLFRVQASLLLGCDGGQSLVREQMLGDGPPQFLGTAVWRAVRPRPADWIVDQGYVGYSAPGQPGFMSFTLGEDGDTIAWNAFAPWPADQLAVIGGGRKAYYDGKEVAGAGAADTGEEAGARAKAEREQATAEGKDRVARALAAFEGYPQALKDLIATSDPAGVTEHGQFCREPEQCQVYARGRVALTGDAAHLATPALGQGCSQAMEDALELGRAIGLHGATPAALAEYERVRLPLSGAVQQASVELFKNGQAGKVGKSEFEVNAEKGFTTRTFEPLVPAEAEVKMAA